MDMQERTIQAALGALILGAMLLSGCLVNPGQPEGSISVGDLIQIPVYGTEIEVYGQVSQLGELRCPCFELASNGKTLYVWYDMMVGEDEVPMPAVDVAGVVNGDWVVVAGELREVDDSPGTFWASAIEVVR